MAWFLHAIPITLIFGAFEPWWFICKRRMNAA